MRQINAVINFKLLNNWIFTRCAIIMISKYLKNIYARTRIFRHPIYEDQHRYEAR